MVNAYLQNTVLCLSEIQTPGCFILCLIFKSGNQIHEKVVRGVVIRLHDLIPHWSVECFDEIVAASPWRWEI